MRLNTAILASMATRVCLAAVLGAREDPPAAKFEPIEPLHFKNLGAKRVRATYGPMLVPGTMDMATGGMKTFVDYDVPMPCHECLITGYLPNLQYENGTTANANSGMWMHHIGVSNLNRTDAACYNWPDRWIAAGNERPALDLTLNSTRKVGYYIRKTDQIMFATDVMNENMEPRTVYLTMEWEYLDGIPDGFDLAIPVWLNYKGACMNESVPVDYTQSAFSVTTKNTWSPKFTGDLFLMQGHVHDGNMKQDIYLDGKKICSSVPSYGESPGFISYGSNAHVTHISSMTECKNFGVVGPNNKFSLTSYYNMTEHAPEMKHDGGFEPIMAIEFLQFARPKDEVIKEILAAPNPDLQAFLNAVAGQ